MGKRRLSREITLQFLYSCECCKNFDKKSLADFMAYIPEIHRIDEVKSGDTHFIEFTRTLIEGILDKMSQIDQIIIKNTANWDFSRLAIIDKNILRIAVFEILYLDDIPPVVSIDEAVDIAKKYSTPDSGKFVNGILDKIKEDFGNSSPKKL
ncbi:MAG: transcription antitermination factor NusB [Candidatus Auribacterota bacterium]|jgi:N utilization substance protein B|nr:transcription antitermination factor NusB [Candidatus Auribacterota bacterium]